MTAPQLESLHQKLADLQAERVATWSTADLRVNVDQRQLLIDTQDVDAYVKVGDLVDAFAVPGVDGEVIELDDLVQRGPLVVIFFRFAGCPACNIALPHYQRALWPRLRDLGANLLALSPQVPDRLRAIKQKHGLEFSVASDLNNELGRRFGILYSYDEASRQAALARNNPIGEVTGTGTWELPKPTVLLIDGNKVVRFVDVAPDWLVRTEAEPILAAVEALKPAGVVVDRSQAAA